MQILKVTPSEKEYSSGTWKKLISWYFVFQMLGNIHMYLKNEYGFIFVFKKQSTK